MLKNTNKYSNNIHEANGNVTPSIKLPFFEILYKSVFAGNKYFAQSYLVAASNAIFPDKARNSEIPIAPPLDLVNTEIINANAAYTIVGNHDKI